MTQRTDRIDQLLRQEIGEILSRDVQDPRIGFVTVTDVETAPDLSTARVWVSVIGQPDERKETLKALSRALPFVRHELGSRVRLRRIPELHLREDDSALRGTRVLRLLAELETGSAADEPRRLSRCQPRYRESADPEDRSPNAHVPAADRPTSGAGRGSGDDRRLTPWLADVPAAAADAIAAARNALVAVTRTRCRHARRRPRRRRDRGAPRGRTTLISTDPVPPLYDSSRAWTGLSATPDDAAAYDLLVVCGLRHARPAGRRARAARPLFERLPRVLVDHHASNTDGGPSDWVDPDAAATCELVALLARQLGVPLDAGDGAMAAALMAGIVMDTSTFAHPNSTPRTLASRGPRRARRAARRDLAPPVPLEAGRAAAPLRRVLDRLQVTPAGGRSTAR
jgi:ribosome-binding factor A